MALSTCTTLDNVAESGGILNLPNFESFLFRASCVISALGISKALSSKSTLSAVYLLDYVLPQVAKLSKTLQSEKLDLTFISSLVEATLNSLDDALSPAANWVLELQPTGHEGESGGSYGC